MSEQNTSVTPTAIGHHFVTAGKDFRHFESEGKSLMRVEDGLPLNMAVRELNCILDSLQELAFDGVVSSGISERKAWLMGFCLDAAGGLGATIEKSLLKAEQDLRA